jgi:hypothetical protein
LRRAISSNRPIPHAATVSTCSYRMANMALSWKECEGVTSASPFATFCASDESGHSSVAEKSGGSVDWAEAQSESLAARHAHAKP